MEILKEKLVGGQKYALMIAKNGNYSLHISYGATDDYRMCESFGKDLDKATEKYDALEKEYEDYMKKEI